MLISITKVRRINFRLHPPTKYVNPNPPSTSRFSFPFFQCSTKCGTGAQYRKVRCQQLLALGEVANRPDRECPRPRPPKEKTCHLRACASYDYERNDVATSKRTTASSSQQPVIKANTGQNYVQGHEKSVRLKVGGRAVIFEGSKVKVRCPVKRFDR